MHQSRVIRPRGSRFCKNFDERSNISQPQKTLKMTFSPIKKIYHSQNLNFPSQKICHMISCILNINSGKSWGSLQKIPKKTEKSQKKGVVADFHKSKKVKCREIPNYRLIVGQDPVTIIFDLGGTSPNPFLHPQNQKKF